MRIILSELQKEKAEVFRSLHHQSHILILPNAWDVASARLFENMGFPAIATSSAGMLVSLGFQDGEAIGRDHFLSVLSRIASVLSVPLSADVLAGFGEDVNSVEFTIKGVIEAGAVGVNLEDFDHVSKKLFPLERQIEKLVSIKRLAKDLDVPIVINARTDALRYAEGNETQKFEEAVRRAQAYRDIGADCVYPMGLAAKDQIAQFVEALGHFPVNVMIRKGLPSLKELEALGVKRVSFGPAASYAAMGFLKRASRQILEEGNFSMLTDDAISFDELNSLAIKKLAVS